MISFNCKESSGSPELPTETSRWRPYKLFSTEEAYVNYEKLYHNTEWRKNIIIMKYFKYYYEDI